MKLKTTFLVLCALVGISAWAGVPDGIGFYATNTGNGWNDNAWEMWFDNTLTTHSNSGILNGLQWTMTGGVGHSEGSSAGTYIAAVDGKAAYVVVADGGDLVFTSPLDFGGQRGWGGSNFKYAAINAIVYNADGSASTFAPTLRLENYTGFGSATETEEELAEKRAAQYDITFTFPGMKDGTMRQTVWSADRDRQVMNVVRRFIITFPNLQAGSVVKLLGLGLYYSLGADGLYKTLAPNSKTTINWFDYDLGDRGQSYMANEAVLTIGRTNETNYGKPFRMGQDSLNVVGVDGGGTLDGFTYPGSCFYDRTPVWQNPDFPAGGSNPSITTDEAMQYFGAWFKYTVDVEQDCYANINLVTGAGPHYIENDRYAGWGGNGGPNFQIKGHEGQIWLRRYGQAYVLALNGENLKTNQTSFPNPFKTEAARNKGGAINDYVYTADEYAALKADQSKWTSTLLEDGTPNDTLFTWDYTNAYWSVSIPKLITDGAVGDQYANVPLKKGKNTLWLKKLAGVDNTFRAILIETTDAVVPVESVVLDETSVTTLPAGESLTVGYTVTPSNATNSVLTWEGLPDGLTAVDNGDNTVTFTYTGDGASKVTVTAKAADGFGAEATLYFKRLGGGSINLPQADPIPAGRAKHLNWTYIYGSIANDLTMKPGETNRLSSDWTVTGAKEVVANGAAGTYRGWAGAVAEGGDVIFSTEQEAFYNKDDGSNVDIAVELITYNENGSQSTFEPCLRLTNTSDGTYKYYKLGRTKDSRNRQTLNVTNVIVPGTGLTDNHFNKIEVVFPDLDEGSVVSVNAIQFDLIGNRTLNSGDNDIIVHMFDKGGEEVGYSAYQNIDNWEFYRRRVDCDSILIQGGAEGGNLTDIDGLAYGSIENWHGVGGFGGNPSDVNGGLENDANGTANAWSTEQVGDYYGQWFNYSFTTTNTAAFATINLAVAQRWVYAITGINNGDHGIVRTPEGKNMIASRRYAGGAYVLELDGKPLKTNQKSYPSLLKDPETMFYTDGLVSGTEDKWSKDEFKEVIQDPTRWASTLINGEANDTLFTWPHILVNDNDYARTFYCDKNVNEDAGDQYVNIPLKAGNHTLKVKNVFGNRNSLGGLRISLKPVTPVSAIRLLEPGTTTEVSDPSIDNLVEGTPVVYDFRIMPSGATLKEIKVTSSNPEVKAVVEMTNETRGWGTITISYEPESSAAGARRFAPAKVSGETTVTIEPADGFDAMDPITVHIGTITGVDDITAVKDVDEVVYYNTLGVAASQPWQGVNVKVTKFTDGSKSTTKVVK